MASTWSPLLGKDGGLLIKNNGKSAGGYGGVTEHCQTAILEDNQTKHQQTSTRTGSLPRSYSHSSSEQFSYSRKPSDSNLCRSSLNNSLRATGASVPSLLELHTSHNTETSRQLLLETNAQERHTIRFQVVVWHIGQIDMIQSRVPATFRVTIFWNAAEPDDNDLDDEPNETASLGGSTRSRQSWKMDGRQRAVQTQDTPDAFPSVQVPAVSILNVVTFETVGEPQVSMLREDTKLMRWSCMYRAVLFQDHWEVYNFPHDDHEISIRLAILADRSSGATWDRHVWKLDLAKAADSAGSIRVPHGVLVDHVKIPEFQYNHERNLEFGFKRLKHGPGGLASKDSCLEIKLKVWRNSSYYDRNIMPLLGMLNLVAITITALEAHRFFERALLTLNITFVEIGMRMTADSKLPTASYQIKMQRILNEYFFGLLSLVLESLVVYELNEYGFAYTGYIDALAALLVLCHNVYTLAMFYTDAERVRREVETPVGGSASSSSYCKG